MKTKKDPIKLMIDTGATNSLLNPNLCHPKWYIPSNKIILKTLQHQIEVFQKVRIPLFKELGNPNEQIDFLIIKFHNFCDGLIGNDLLQRFNATIDYKNNQLIFNENAIPLYFQNKENKIIVTDDDKDVVETVNDTNSSIDYYKTIINEGTIVDHEHFNIIEPREFKSIQDQIRSEHLNKEEKHKLIKLINSYSEIFYQENSDLTFTNEIKH